MKRKVTILFICVILALLTGCQQNQSSNKAAGDEVTHAFDSIGGEVTQTTAFVIANEYIPDYEATYYRLVDGQNEAEKETMFQTAERSMP